MRTKSVERSFRATPAALRDIRAFVRQKARKTRLGTQEVEDVVLAVSEAATNAVIHSNTPEILVGWSKSGGYIEVCIKDHGIFKHRMPGPTHDVGGRGIPIMVALMDDVTLSPGTEERPGTVIRLTKRLNARASAAQRPVGRRLMRA
jgi:anti-sigma regulatory factor (Ser/Thr protein kinase)